MPISYESAAMTLCEQSNWAVSNLELQKHLYLAHMRFLGLRNEALIRDGSFEAWKLGPVIAPLYHEAKRFGSKPIREGYFAVRRNLRLPEHADIRYVYGLFGHLTPGQLVELTHRQGGAWDQYYGPDEDHIVIPDRAIRREFLDNPF